MPGWMHDRRDARAAQILLGVISGAAFALLAYLLMGRDQGPPAMFPYQDKVLHFMAFAGVTAPAVLALPKRYLLFWVGHMALVALGTEYFQGLVYEQRTASAADALANALGIAAAVLICVPLRGFVVERATARA